MCACHVCTNVCVHVFVCTCVCVLWCVCIYVCVHTVCAAYDRQQQEKSPINMKSLLKRLYSLASHPSASKRLGAALAFNNIYTVFRSVCVCVRCVCVCVCVCYMCW